MLVICNGAIKSGSTWLYNILVNLVDLERPPDWYLTANSRARQSNPCIRPDMLAEFLATEDHHSVDYISKNHLARTEHRDLVLSYNSVFVFDIERDVRDVVVSSYYDARNRHGYGGTFSEYYWDEGRYTADRVIRYHGVWRDAGDRFCMASYEGLHEDFAAEVRRIGATLGVALDDDRIERLREQTSMGQLRRRYQDHELYRGDRFFRKGVVGDWRNHFDEPMADDIQRIEIKGIGPLDWRGLRRRLLGQISHRDRK